ncbi:alpha-amylase-like [Brevipalpus obovatus]|uniref:alpha-amylase-like n=1 Tax=Brevipalpus obovatus TaxID=246614 RepID=UPI003D9E0721
MNKLYFLLLSIQVNFIGIISAESIDKYDDPHFKDDRATSVELWEWRFDEVAKECERFLGPNGYGGVLISTVWEHELMENPVVNNKYGLISYKIMTRYGNEAQLADMAERCNSVGVRVYVDCNIGTTSFPYKGGGFSGTPLDGRNRSYPGIPFSMENFNYGPSCPTKSGNIENPKNPIQLRNCMLTGLNDLDNGQKYVQDKIVEAINKLIGSGIAGIRIDASYLNWLKNLKKISERTNDLDIRFFEKNSTIHIFHSIKYESGLKPSPGPNPEGYQKIGSIVAVDARRKIVDAFRKRDYERIADLITPHDEAWNRIPSQSAVILIDSAAYQNEDLPSDAINFRLPYTLIRATAFMLAWPYGLPLVMSSFNYTIAPAPEFWKLNPMARKWPAARAPVGPNGFSADVIIKSDSSCGYPWICEHRWKSISNMVKFRNVIGDEPVENWVILGEDVIAFSRGSKGFILIVNDASLINYEFQTGLPEGEYCDIISGNLTGDPKKPCSGDIIKVQSDGRAQIYLDVGTDKTSVIAFHIKSRVPEEFRDSFK